MSIEIKFWTNVFSIRKKLQSRTKYSRQIHKIKQKNVSLERFLAYVLQFSSKLSKIGF